MKELAFYSVANGGQCTTAMVIAMTSSYVRILCMYATVSV